MENNYIDDSNITSLDRIFENGDSISRESIEEMVEHNAGHIILNPSNIFKCSIPLPNKKVGIFSFIMMAENYLLKPYKKEIISNHEFRKQYKNPGRIADDVCNIDPTIFK